MRETKLEMVKEFMEIFDKDNIRRSPSLTSKEVYELRYRLLQEENNEYLEACKKGDIVGVLDAITDMLYVLYGTVITHGLEDVIDKAFEEVHRSNMSKLGEDGKPIRRKDGKILKGPNYFKPQLDKYVDGKVIIDTEKVEKELKELGVRVGITCINNNKWQVDTGYTPLELPLKFLITTINEKLRNVKISDNGIIEKMIDHIYVVYGKNKKKDKYREFVKFCHDELDRLVDEYKKEDERIEKNYSGDKFEIYVYTHGDHVTSVIDLLIRLFIDYGTLIRRRLREEFNIEIY